LKTKLLTFALLLSILPFIIASGETPELTEVENITCMEIGFSLTGTLLFSDCYAGGPGASSCTVSQCSVTCIEGFYACCRLGGGCYCEEYGSGPGDEEDEEIDP